MMSSLSLSVSQKNKTKNTSVAETRSVTFKESRYKIKQMTAIIFSHIAYLRKIFPEKAFVDDDRILGDKTVKVLATNPGCKKAYLMSRYIKSALEAFDLEYMKKFGMEIFSPEGEPIEVFFLKYDYESDGSCSLSIGGKNSQNEEIDIAKDINGVIDSLNHAFESLGPLPPKYNIKLRIYYDGDKTPIDYTPEFFYESEPFRWRKEKNFKRSICGDVKTGHHNIVLEVGTKSEQVIEYKRKTIISTKNQPKTETTNEQLLPEMKCYDINKFMPGTSTDSYQDIFGSKIKLTRLMDETNFEKRDHSIREDDSIDSSSVRTKSIKSLSSPLNIPTSPELLHSLGQKSVRSDSTTQKLEIGTNSGQVSEYKIKYENQDEEWNIPGTSTDYALYQEINPSKIKLSRLMDETVHFEKPDLSIIPEEGIIDSSSIDSPKSSSSLSIIPPTPEHKFEEKIHPDMNFSVDLSYRNSSAYELKKFFTQQIMIKESNVKCICKLDFKDEDVFLCNHCNNLQHYLCYKLWPGSDDPEILCCFSCAEDDPSLTCTDPDLIKYTNHVETLAQYRRLMYNMQWRKTITEEVMISKYNVSRDKVQNVIVLLESEGYITQSKGCYIIKRKLLEQGLKKYFVH